MLQQQIYDVCGGAHEVDIAYRGKLTSTGSPIQASAPVFSITNSFLETHRSTTGHCPQQAVVDLDHLLDCLTGNPITRRSS